MNDGDHKHLSVVTGAMEVMFGTLPGKRLFTDMNLHIPIVPFSRRRVTACLPWQGRPSGCRYLFKRPDIDVWTSRSPSPLLVRHHGTTVTSLREPSCRYTPGHCARFRSLQTSTVEVLWFEESPSTAWSQTPLAFR